MANIQYRHGKWKREASIEYWDFDQQHGQIDMQEPFQVQPGDIFERIVLQASVLM